MSRTRKTQRLAHNLLAFLTLLMLWRAWKSERIMHNYHTLLARVHGE